MATFRGQVAQAAQTNRMALSAVRKGKRAAPDRVLLVGVEGVGKSTFAGDAPDVVFIAAEDGIRHLNVASFPEPKTFGDVLDAIRTLTNEEHSYRTLAVDTLDWIEPLVWRQVCTDNKWESLESAGYGKGYAIALDEWRKLIVALDTLRSTRQMEIILLAHAAIRTFSNPTGQDFSRYECKLHRGAAALVREWTDVNLFATHEEFAAKKQGEMRVKGVSTGRRVIYTTRSAAWDAKNRYGLPEELPLSYAEYAAARDSGRPGDPAKLETEARELLAQVRDEAKRGQIESFLNESSGDASKLAKAVDRLRSIVAEAA